MASLAAARRSATEYAFAAAGRHYERVLELWQAVPDASALVGLDLAAVLSEASRSVALAGQATRSLALAREAVAAFDLASDPEHAALLEERLAWAATEFGDLEVASAALVSAVARIETAGPSPVRARVLTSFARNRYIRGLDGVVAAAERAIDAARAVASRDAEADALVTLGGALRDIGDPVGAIRRLEEAIAIARDIGDVWELGRAYDQLAGAIDESGDIEGAIEITRTGFEEARRLGVGRAFSPKHLAEQAWRLLNVGRWTEARACLDEAALMHPEGIMRLLYCTTAALLATISGERDVALAFVTEARALQTGLRDPRWTAWLHSIIAQGDLLDGDPEAARQQVIEGLAGAPRVGEISYLCRHGSEAEADLAELGRAQRRPADVEVARARAGELLARSRALVASFPDPASPTLHVLWASQAVIEAEMTRLEGASDPARWAVAAQLWTGVHQPYETAYAHFREGEALLAEGHRRAEAESALRAAHQSVVALGARPLRERIEALARRARIDLSGSGAALARRPSPPGRRPTRSG